MKYSYCDTDTLLLNDELGFWNHTLWIVEYILNKGFNVADVQKDLLKYVVIIKSKIKYEIYIIQIDTYLFRNLSHKKEGNIGIIILEWK